MRNNILLGGISLALGLGFSLARPHINQNVDKCNTAECIDLANNMMSMMNTSVNPCDNFFEYACGNALESPLTSTWRLLVKRMVAILSDKDLPMDSEALKKARAAYRTCKEKPMVESDEGGLSNQIEDYLGQWPMLSEGFKESTSEDWFNTLVTAEKELLFQDFPLVTVELNKYTINGDIETVLELELHHSAFEEGAFLIEGAKNAKSQIYLQAMKNVSQLLTGETNEAVLEKVLDLGVNISAVYLGQESEFNMDENSPDVMNSLPPSAWKYLDELSRHFKTDFTLELINEKRFKYLIKIFRQADQETISIFLAWMILKDNLCYLGSEELCQIKHAIQELTMDYQDDCYFSIRNSFQLPLNKEYIRRHFPVEYLDQIEHLAERIQDGFLDILLLDLPWLDPVTRARVLIKVSKINLCMAYPDGFMDDKEGDNQIDRLYDDLLINEHSYLQNEYRFRELKVPILFRRLSLQSRYLGNCTMADFENDLTQVNAYYVPAKNMVGLFMTILQDPFYVKDVPKYINYARVGYAMGHEFGHSLDDGGINFNEYAQDITRLTKLSEPFFNEKKNCLINQTNKQYYPEVEKYVNGKNTIGESISDNIGVREAYHAYNDWASRQESPEPTIRGIDLNQNQLFWVRVAQTWCPKQSRDELLYNLRDVHPPHRERANLPMTNNEDFARDFECPPGTPMNPLKKCRLWK